MSTEPSVGISAFTTTTPAFRAVTKQRWSDFIVHEVALSGRVVELVAIARPAPASASDTAAAASPDAAAVEAELAASLGAAAAADALALNAGGDGGDGAADEVVLAADNDKERRRAVHQLVKRLLPALSSDTVDRDGGKCVRLLPKRSPRRADGGGGKRQRVDRREEWPAEAGGRKHLGFTLYKENRDTHDALAQLARALRLPPNALGFAGTKDKRAVTAQRVTAFKVTAERLRQLMAAAPFGESIVVGDDLTYDEEPLRLGALAGNRFTIVLRDATCSAADLEAAAAALGEAGFVNYFGLQRFGSNAAAGTHAVGAAMLRSEWQAAIDLVMAPFPHDSGRGDTGERQAREAWAATRDPDAALPHLPRWMGAERSLLEGIKQLGPTNGFGALMKLPRTLRMMYLHAFQSLVWNRAATERIRLYGADRAVAGDLVTVDGEGGGGAAAAAGGGADVGADAAGGAADADAAADDGGIGAVHVVSEAEAAAGTYSAEQVVLPLPGHLTTLPTNAVGDFIRASLEEHGLTMGSFDHHSKEISLKGAYAAQFGAQFFAAHSAQFSDGSAPSLRRYRRLLARPAALEWKVLRYSDPTAPLALTDLARLRGEPEPAGEPDGARTALRLTFTLPSSTYATMLLRELTKQSTELAHQNQLNAREVAAPAAPGDGAPPAAPPVDDARDDAPGVAAA